MFGLILCVSLLVYRVESFNEQNREFQGRSSKKMRSVESAMTSDQTTSFSFDSNRRGWQKFNSWKSNDPQSMTCASVAYSVVIENKTQQYLLMITADRNCQKVPDKSNVFESWLYTVDTKSWQELDKFSPLPRKPVMIQLCFNIIALEAVDTESFLNSNKAWILDTSSLEWQQKQLDIELQQYTNHNMIKSEFRGISIQQLESNCQCQQSALIIMQENVDDSNVMKQTIYEVRCVFRAGIESYQRKMVKANITLIPRFESTLVCSCSNCMGLYDPATKSLWKFENKTWKNVSTIPDDVQPFQNVLSKSFGCAIAKETSSYLAFNIRDKKVVNFSLKYNRYSIETVGGNLPDRWYETVVSTVAETQHKIIVFITNIRTGTTTAWTLTFGNKVWIWTIWLAPDIAPSSRFDLTYAIRDQTLTVLGGYDEYSISKEASYQQPLTGLVWSLELTTMRWWLKFKGDASDFVEYYGSCWISSSCLLVLRHNELQDMEAWVYNSSDNSWKYLISPSLMKRRSYMSIVAVNATSAISFGGLDLKYKTVFDEMWILHLTSNVQWKRLMGDTVNTGRPSARSGHAAVMMQSKMYVFGGMNAANKCLNDLWVFDVNIKRWAEVTPVNERPDLSDFGPCTYSATSTPGQLIVTVTCDMKAFFAKGSCALNDGHVAIQTWMFIVHLKVWHLIDSTPDRGTDEYLKWIDEFTFNTVYWKGFILMYDSYNVNVKYLAVRCPAGFSSTNISEQPCTFCKKGFYRETIYSDSNCVACPHGLTTANLGAHNITECTVCKVDLCKYGKCVPDFSRKTLRPICQCYVGYTGSTCQYPTYYLMVAGLILFAVIFSAGVTTLVLMLKRKTLHERALRREVDALTDVWQIDETEVASQDIIGCGASGYVYKAVYRDIIVAVKKMVAVGLPKSIEDFETKIMFMRTVRHKNIVLFIGAGKSQPEDVPFLVMEYMERGSLRNVLHDLSIDIDYDRKLSFAMDAARGMHFLHTLEPPRIHRDLKSDNLLVSKNWIVKVADFGLGRAVTNDLRRNENPHIEHGNRSDPGNIPLTPLLSQREDLSFSGVGTARWRAPELTLRLAYDTAVDLYRYYDPKEIQLITYRHGVEIGIMQTFSKLRQGNRQT